MRLTLKHTMLKVDDHEKALAFYRGVLGFTVRGDVEFEGLRWVTVSPPAQPEVEIVLEPPSADPNTSAADKQAIAEMMAKGIMGMLVFATDDCDATFDHAPRAARKDGETDERLFAVAAWRWAPYFTDAERAALALTEAVTRLADQEDPIPDAVWDEAAKHYDEPALATLILHISLVNV